MSIRSRKQHSPRFRWRSLFFILIGGLALLFAAWCAWLDHQVRQRFDGALWKVPAEVYARPLELYEGAQVSQDALLLELNALGYQQTDPRGGEGRYRVRGSTVILHSRAFEFEDGAQEAIRARIHFDSDSVADITTWSENRALPLVRLDPVSLGRLSTQSHEERLLLPLDQIPSTLVEMLIAVEDRNFYDHFGIDFRGIARALWMNLRAGSIVQGGSTLTQQLVKNLFLTAERSFVRKINEALMSIMVEAHYSKKLILEAYLNEVYLGQSGRTAIHGFGLAAQFYFGRSLDSLSIAEQALLVGMVKGPSYYSPARHPERAIERRNQVLAVAWSHQIISIGVRDQLSNSNIHLNQTHKFSSSQHPAFMGLLRRQLRRDYQDEDLLEGGLRIFSTLDPLIQARSEQTLSRRLAQLQPGREHLNGAVVVSRVTDGEVLSVVGDREPEYAGFNRAVDAVRPVGSLIKPVIYLTALQRKDQYSVLTPLIDEPFELEMEDGSIWAPKNYDLEFNGLVTLRRALVESLNVPTVRLGLDLGVNHVMATLKNLGVRRPLNVYPAALLGSEGLSPVEVNQVYQTLSAGGFYSPLRTVRSVRTASGETLQRYPLTVRRVADPGAVYLVNTLLQEVTRHGTAKALQYLLPTGLEVAGKTGTTDDARDSWFSGFSNDLVATVWVGNDDNLPIGLTGSQGAMRVWADLVSSLSAQPLSLNYPDGVEILSVDRQSLGIAGSGCDDVEPVPFMKGGVRTDYAPCYQPGEDVRFQTERKSWWQNLFR